MSHLQSLMKQHCTLLAVLCGNFVDRQKGEVSRGDSYPFPELVSDGRLEVHTLTNPTFDVFLETQKALEANILYFQGEHRVDEEKIGSIVWENTDLSDPQILSSLIDLPLPTIVYLEAPNTEKIAQALHAKGVPYVIYWKNAFSSYSASIFRQALLSVVQSSCCHTWDAFQLANASFRLYCVRNNYVLPDNSKKISSKHGPRFLGDAPKIAISPSEREGVVEEDLSDIFPAIKIYDEDVDMRFLICGVSCPLDACLLGSLEDGLNALLNIEMTSGGGDEPPRRSFTSQVYRKTKLLIRGRGGGREDSSTPPPSATPQIVSSTFPSSSQQAAVPFPTTPGLYYYAGPPPSSQQHIGASTSQPPSDTSPTDEADSRMLIAPDGDTFYPSSQPTHKVRDIIRSRFDAPYISWKKIPLNVRDMWFREFEKDFKWLPQHHDRVRKNFEKRGSTRLRDMFTDIRKKGERPLWIGEDVWADLCAAWGTLEYIQKRAQNKGNRALDSAGMGTSLHTGGSIPHAEHRRRLIRGSKLLNRVSATPPPLQAETFSRGVVTMRCDLTTCSSAHISLLVSGSPQTCFDDQLLESHIKNDLIEKSQLVHSSPTCDETKSSLADSLSFGSIACGASVFEVRMKVPAWAAQVLKHLAPEISYRSLVAIGIASVQGTPVASFEKEDADRLLFFCTRQGMEVSSEDVLINHMPSWCSSFVCDRSRPNPELKPIVPFNQAVGNGTIHTKIDRNHNDKRSAERNHMSVLHSRKKLKVAAMKPIPCLRQHRMLPFTKIAAPDAYDGTQAKPNLAVVPATKSNSIPAVPLSHRKSMPSSQTHQILPLNPLPMKKHGCNRAPIQVCPEEEFLKDVLQFLVLRGHNRLVPQGGLSEFPDAILNAKRLDLYNLYREVVSRGGFYVGNGINWKGQVFSKMRNHTLTNRMTGVGNTLKRHYETYLLEYELAHDDVDRECCLLCHSSAPGDWVNCGLCGEWAHFGCDRRQGLGTFKDYAKTDGLEYICPHCSIKNYSDKTKPLKIANGYSSTTVSWHL